MKRIIALIMAALLLVTLTACSEDNTSEYDHLNTTSSDEGLNAQYQIVTDAIAEIYADGQPATTQEVVDGVTAVMPVQMPMPMEDQFLEFIGIDLANVSEYAGVVSSINVSTDELIVIRANDGMVDTIVTNLTERRDARTKEFETYLADQHEKATYGKILVYGNDVILAIMGDTLQYDMSDGSGEAAPMLPSEDTPVAEIPAD